MQTEQLITCKCGTWLMTEGWLDRIVLFVESPKTGRRFDIGGGWKRELPASVVAKIKQCQGTADFTVDELKQIDVVHEQHWRRFKPVVSYWLRDGPPKERPRLPFY